MLIFDLCPDSAWSWDNVDSGPSIMMQYVHGTMWIWTPYPDAAGPRGRVDLPSIRMLGEAILMGGTGGTNLPW